jgi:hypothetical protein
MPSMEPGYPPQQQPGYPPPQYMPQGGQPQGNGMAVAALVVGLIGLVLFGVVMGILAIIFGALGIGKANKIGGKGKGMAIAGLILGVVDILVFIVLMAVAFS